LFNRRPVTRLLAGLAFLALVAAGAHLGFGQDPAPPLEGGTLRVEVDVVSLYATVKDRRGALVTDLEASDFEVREDGRRQEVRYFARETDRPLTLALLFDTSGSQQAVLQEEKEATIRFLRQVLRPSDLALLMTFDTDVFLQQDFTSDVERLEAAVHRTRIHAAGPPGPVQGPFPTAPIAGTRLHDAVFLAAEEKLAGEVGRKAIILITDGQDTGSKVNEKRALEVAQRSDVMIYAVVIADPHLYARFGYPYEGTSVMKRMTRETGGRAIFPRNARDLKEAFDEIAAELRSQYYLGYTPTHRARDGRFRKVEIKVKQGGLRVQARRGYYAPQF
jgi:VWFA-related protein